MRIWFSLLFLCFGFLGFTQSLEDEIYTATENFIASKNDSTFKILTDKEIGFQKQASTNDEFLALVFLKNNKAFHLKKKNTYSKAILAYENAWKLYSDKSLAKIADYDIIEFCLKPLGNLYTKTNNFTNAENTIKEYTSLAQKQKNNKQYVAGIINLAVLYKTLNRYSEVLKLTDNVLVAKELNVEQKQNLKDLNLQSKIALNQLKNLNELEEKNSPSYYQNAYILSLKDNKPANALGYFLQYENLKLKQKITLRELAKFYVEKANLHFRISNVEHPSENLKNAKTAIEMAIKTLLPTYTKGSIPSTELLYAENTFIDVFDLAASLENNTSEALRYYNLSFYVSNLVQGELTSQEAQLFNLANDRKRAEACLELLYFEYQKKITAEVLEQALNYAEIGKSEVLARNYEKKLLLEKHPNDSLLLREKELRQKQEQLTHVLVNAIKKNDSISNKLLTTSIALKQTQQLITEKHPTQKKEINLRSIQNKLKNNEATLMVFFNGKKSSYQFIISPQESKFLRKKKTVESNGIISDFIHCFDNASVITNDIDFFKKRANEVYTYLDMEMATGTKNLILIPDGKLNFVPFDALLRKVPKTNNFAKMPFVVSDQQLSYNTSINLYLKENKTSASKKVLGIFPVFENTQQPLSFSITEAENLKRLTNAEILLKEKATKANFLKIAKDYDILHLSTHASGGDFNNSASLLFFDKPILLNELYALDLNPDLVVLSACETGVGTVYNGEGTMSIARGFQYAGAPNVLYSLWQVNDKSTATIMDLFYKSYDRTKSAAAANWQSKLDFLQDETIGNAKKSPYYWSSFVYSGVIEAEKTGNWIYFYGIGLLLILVVLLLWIVKRK